MKEVKRNRFYLIFLIFSLIVFFTYRLNKDESLLENNFARKYYSVSMIKKKMEVSEKTFFEFQIDCGDEFIEKNDELYMKFGDHFSKFENGKLKTHLWFDSKFVEYGPVLYLIRDNKVYVKSIKETFPIYRETRKYKIQLCDFSNRIIPIR
jgi:hypothetical protein